MSVTAFAELQELDPYRLENMDTYSNLLYIKVGYNSVYTLVDKHF